MRFHCLFEQSGTFKNEFIKLGYEAYDYDILNDFGQTNYVIDLFNEIEKGYNNEESVFDNISMEDQILAFFPCTRFEDQIQMAFRGTQNQQQKWNIEKKLEYDLILHQELTQLYQLVTKLAIICVRKGLKLIIENPHSTTHYLVKYWCIPYTLLDKDRTERGDYFRKPTQYWFINCTPKYNMIMEAYIIQERKVIEYTHNKVERSMISTEYANRFIREFILEKGE